MSRKKSKPVYLDDETYARAVLKAAAKGRSYSNYVEHLIKQDIKTPEATR